MEITTERKADGTYELHLEKVTLDEIVSLYLYLNVPVSVVVVANRNDATGLKGLSEELFPLWRTADCLMGGRIENRSSDDVNAWIVDYLDEPKHPVAKNLTLTIASNVVERVFA